MAEMDDARRTAQLDDVEKRLSELKVKVDESLRDDMEDIAMLSTLQSQATAIKQDELVMPYGFQEPHWAKAHAQFAQDVLVGVNLATYTMDEREEAIHLHSSQAIALRDYLVSLDMGD